MIAQVNHIFLRFDVESEIENTIQDVSGAIIKLDDISGRDLGFPVLSYQFESTF